jgi:hypothetical protein
MADILADNIISPVSTYLSVDFTGATGSSPSFKDPFTAAFFFHTGVVGTPKFPTAVPLATGAGQLASAYEADWYNRIHTIPHSLALGTVLQLTQRTVEVWNANFSSRTLTAIPFFDVTGIQISGGLGILPQTYGPLRTSIFTFTIDVIGPPRIDAIYFFDFGSEAPSVVITGDRAVVFAYEPQRPTIERISFLTDVLESYNGTEQRIALRTSPRLMYIYDYLLPDAVDYSRALNTMSGNIGNGFAVPVWWDLRTLTADVAPAATVVKCSTAFADFRDGGLALLWRSPQDFEVLQIATVSPTQLNLAFPTSGSSSALTTLCMPLVISFLSDPVENSRTPNNKGTVRATWEAFDTPDRATPDGSITMYKGLPLVDDLNFTDGNSSEGFGQGTARIDSGIGPIAFIRKRFPKLSFQKGWAAQSLTTLAALRGLLYALRGRQRSFYMPTFREDFVLAAGVAPSDASLTVKPVDYNRFVTPVEPLKNLAVYLKNGSVYYREILAAVPSGLNEALTLDASFGVAFQPADVLRISYLVRCRFDSDDIDIRHNDLRQGDVQMPVVGVTA